MVQNNIWDSVMHFNSFSDHKPFSHQHHTIIEQENTPSKFGHLFMVKMKLFSVSLKICHK